MSFDWDYYYCPRCSKKYRSTECEDRLDWWILFFRTLNDIIDRCASHRADYPSKVLNELSLFHSSLYHSHSQQYVQSTSTTQSRSILSAIAKSILEHFKQCGKWMDGIYPLFQGQVSFTQSFDISSQRLMIMNG